MPKPSTPAFVRCSIIDITFKPPLIHSFQIWYILITPSIPFNIFISLIFKIVPSKSLPQCPTFRAIQKYRPNYHLIYLTFQFDRLPPIADHSAQFSPFLSYSAYTIITEFTIILYYQT